MKIFIILFNILIFILSSSLYSQILNRINNFIFNNKTSNQINLNDEFFNQLIQKNNFVKELIKNDELEKSYPLLKEISFEVNKLLKLNNIEKNYENKIKNINTNLLINFGSWHSKKGNYVQANNYFKKVLDEDPTNIHGLIQYSHLAILEKNFSKAKNLIQKAYYINNESPDVQIAYAYFQLQLLKKNKDESSKFEKYEKAKNSLIKSLKFENQNQNYETFIELALLNLNLKNFDEAIQYLQTIENKYGNNDYIKYLNALILLIKIQDKNFNLENILNPLKQLYEISEQNEIARTCLYYLLQDLKFKEINSPFIDSLRKKLSQKYITFNNTFNLDFRNEFNLLAYDLDNSNYETFKYKIFELTKNKDIEGFINFYNLALSKKINVIKFKNDLDEILYNKLDYLTFQENLFSPFYDKEKNNYIRSSKKILVFSFNSDELLSHYPNLGELIARLLTQSFSKINSVTSVNQNIRKNIFDKININFNNIKSNSNYDNTPLIFKNEYLNFIQNNFNNEKIDYLLTGTYKILKNNKLEINYELHDNNTKLKVLSKKLEFENPFVLTKMVIKLKEDIYKFIPIQGNVIKVKNKFLIINLGRYDGLNDKSLVSTIINNKEVRLKVLQADAFISKIEIPLNLNKSSFEIGANVYFK